MVEVAPISGLRLGKGEYQHDERTLMLINFIAPEIRFPSKFDFDKGRTPLPIRMWGNDEWGDCVIAGQANHLLRNERVEQRRTVKLYDKHVIDRYKTLTGAQTPGDSRDEGLVVLQAMRDWRGNGFPVDNRNYSTAAFGELEPQDGAQLRKAMYLLHGIHMGFWLPRAAQQMTDQGFWDYQGQSGAEWAPGSWGGHLVYAKKYDTDSISVLTWGREIPVSNAFVAKYCDEAWAVVDNFNSWKVKQTIDVPALKSYLRDIGAKVDE